MSVEVDCDPNDNEAPPKGCCRSFGVLLGMMCGMTFFVSSIATGAVTGTLTALEDEYDIQPTLLGVIIVMYDVAYVVTSVPAAHFFHNHIPRAIGCGAILFGGAAVMYSFGTGVGVFIPAQLIMGIGATPLWVLGFVHVDDNVRNSDRDSLSAAKHYGKVLASTPIGVVIGLVLTGMFLKDCEGTDDSCGADENTTANITFAVPESPEYLQDCSKWSYSFWILACFLVPFAIWFFFADGARAAAARQVTPNCPDEVEKKRRAAEIKLKQKTLKEGGLWNALKFLLTHKELVLIMLSHGCTAFVGSALVAFSPRFLERQLCHSKSTANLLVAIFVPFVCIAFYVGGLVIEKFKVGIKRQWLILSALHLGSVPFFFAFYAESTVLFMFLLTIPLFCLFLPNTTSLNIAKTVVPQHLRAHAMALMQIAARTLGAIPGPIVMGVLLDSDALSDRASYVFVGTTWTALGGLFGLAGYFVSTADADAEREAEYELRAREEEEAAGTPQEMVAEQESNKEA